MHFDWYSATIHDNSNEKLINFLADMQVQIKELDKGMNGYTEVGLLLGLNKESRGKLLTGGVNEYPHVTASGTEYPNELAAMVRKHFPDNHQVTRLDSAQDFDEVGAFDKFCKIGIELANRRNLRINQVGDWVNNKPGRTLYLGSPKSSAMVRIYEKGEELKARAPYHMRQFISDNLVRVEMQCRPKRNQREKAAVVTPEEVWGFANWTKELASSVLELDVPRVKVDDWRKNTDLKAIAWMCKQYGGALERMAHSMGWSNLGLYLRDMVSDVKRVQEPNKDYLSWDIEQLEREYQMAKAFEEDEGSVL